MSNLLTPLGTATIPFQLELAGELVAADSVSAQVYKGVVLTSIVPSISNPSTGIYWVSFTVPSNWADFDTASVRLNATVNGKPITLTKPAGTVFGVSIAQRIEDIFGKVDQIVITAGKVEATIGSTPVELSTELTDAIRALLALSGYRIGTPATNTATSIQAGSYQVQFNNVDANTTIITRIS